MARLISRQNAAELLGCSMQTVTNWVNKGIIVGHTVDNHLMVDSNSINQLLDDLKDLDQMEQRINELNMNCKAILGKMSSEELKAWRKDNFENKGILHEDRI